MQREAQLVAGERQTTDRKYGARRAVVEDRKPAAAGEACNRAQPKRRGFAQIRRCGGEHGQAGGGSNERQPEGGREQDRGPVSQPGNCRERLMLEHIQHAGDQRKARHQEQG
jgi:hypothetical protein